MIRETEVFLSRRLRDDNTDGARRLSLDAILRPDSWRLGHGRP